MALESAADRAEFLSEFGVEAAVKVSGRLKTTITVIFDHEYEQTMETEGRAPVALAHDVDIEDIAQGDTLTISGTTYYIKNVRPDGTGWSELILSEDKVE
jgi:hypothetical protein